MNGEYISIETLKIIQSLEKENKRLSTELEIEKDISDGMLETIDKAIEYIKRKIVDIDFIRKNYNIDDLYDFNISFKCVEDLVKILRGDKNGNNK